MVEASTVVWRIEILHSVSSADRRQERRTAYRKWGAIRLIGASLFIAGWLTFPASAEQVTERSEFWPEVDTYIRMNQDSRLLLVYSSTRKDNLETRATWTAGGFVDFFFRRLVDHAERQHPDSARKRMLMFRAGYLYSPTPTGVTKPSTQHIPTLLADTRFSLPWKTILAERNRFDMRIVNGDFTPRYRNRLTIERPFKAGRFEIAPYLQAEASYDWKYDAFNRVRYSAGLDWTASKFLVLESYYTRQRDTKASPEYIHALGMTLQLHLR